MKELHSSVGHKTTLVLFSCLLRERHHLHKDDKNNVLERRPLVELEKAFPQAPDKRSQLGGGRMRWEDEERRTEEDRGERGRRKKAGLDEGGR